MAVDELTVRHKVIKAVEFRLDNYLSGYEHLRPELRWQYADCFSRNLVAQLRVFVYQAGEAEKTVSYPANWWEAFKVQWFPGWALKRWPPVETKVTFTARAMLPDIPFEGQERVVYRLEAVER